MSSDKFDWRVSYRKQGSVGGRMHHRIYRDMTDTEVLAKAPEFITVNNVVYVRYGFTRLEEAEQDTV